MQDDIKPPGANQPTEPAGGDEPMEPPPEQPKQPEDESAPNEQHLPQKPAEEAKPKESLPTPAALKNRPDSHKESHVGPIILAIILLIFLAAVAIVSETQTDF